MGIRRARWLAGGIAAASATLIAAGVVLAFLDRHLVPASQTNWDFSDLFGYAEDLSIPLIAVVIAARCPRNPIGWLGLTAGIVEAVAAFATSYGLRALVAAPGSLPAGRAAMWLVNSVWIIPIAMAAFVILLFPTGRLMSARWRPAASFVAGAFGLVLVAAVIGATRDYARPFAQSGTTQPAALLQAVLLLTTAAMLVCAVTVTVRFVRSAGEERLQLKWFATAAALVAVALIASIAVSAAATVVLLNVAFFCLNGSIAIAVLKYRLYDIDIVISKAVQYGCLAAFITAVYAALVIGVGAAVGDQHSVLLSALAAAVVAVAFQPVRDRAARLANRVVYGRRATPYQVLSEFARRIGGTYADEEVLPQMARLVAAGTGARQVVVWLRTAGELLPAASAGDAVTAGPLAVGGQALPALPDSDVAVPVMHQGELLGAITVRMPRDEALRPAGAQLLADVASQAGLVLSNAGLISDLRTSRQRLVTAQDETRRRLERNLHDGAQQELVALAIKLRITEAVLDEDPAEARQLLVELQADTAGALENLRALARGIYPPMLADFGLVTALNGQAGKSPVPLTVQADGIGRFPQDTEAAVYFCCLEALQNTAKYAGASAARIALGVQDGTLRFAVSDDGAGYDAARTPLGAGMRNMSDRLAALGGWLEVMSAPGAGTTVTGYLPVPGGGPSPGGKQAF